VAWCGVSVFRVCVCGGLMACAGGVLCSGCGVLCSLLFVVLHLHLCD
jgi:hypothetical protein